MKKALGSEEEAHHARQPLAQENPGTSGLGGESHEEHLLGLPISPLGGAPRKKRAMIAVGHSILVIFYHMMRTGSDYADLGGDFFDRLEPERLTRYYVKRLERLGHKVTLETSVTT